MIVPDYLPDTPEVRKDLADYYDAIAHFDSDCGFILDQLEAQGVSNDTLVIMTSDNGMPFPRAKGTLYEAGIATPLIVSWPGRVSPGGQRKPGHRPGFTRNGISCRRGQYPPKLRGDPFIPGSRWALTSPAQVCFCGTQLAR